MKLSLSRMPRPTLVDVSDQVGAFFDIDNTIVRGASLFHLARGMSERGMLTRGDLAKAGAKQARFLLRGSESTGDMAEAMQSALAFVAGRDVAEVTAVGAEIFDDRMIDKLWPGTLELARAHVAKGQQVWLVSATPTELAHLMALRLGLTGGLGTAAEVVDGRYTGRLSGAPLHGLTKAMAISELAAEHSIDLANSYAYSDSINDVPLLELVGNPVAINPDGPLRAHARVRNWPIRDFRRQKMRRVGLKGAVTAAGAALAVGAVAAATHRRAARV
jgi:HAD superfamily hydrolase (TIGR01490 family)